MKDDGTWGPSTGRSDSATLEAKPADEKYPVIASVLLSIAGPALCNELGYEVRLGGLDASS